MTFTPFQLEIIIHHHWSTADFPRSAAPKYEEEVGTLCGLDLLTPAKSGCGYTTTRRGKAFMESLYNTQIPKRAYIDSNERILTIENTDESTTL